ncbi:hypothetical protein SAMN05216169_10832 [Anoxybacillus pushchinoensis]|jgi:hypothetical protein|uniref:Uncharacterized protein n=1 Tax=Anoxybacillus pushchinoensis TaxID=150248 RepID=A0A1I0U4I9_9BACL|nr:hypothetical protein [Anoxybacillus pushchinoensis]QAV27743.1 hypothetical protein BTDUT50_14815 [Neobacillus thermocopriae]SFA58971.1 hypothetical protein SAMN05216169_10832 [Anoxybacillus pushchinoensis]
MKVFVAGPRAVSVLNKQVKERLSNIINNNFTVLVGDANGVDKQVQKFLHSVNYRNVKVYATNGRARNNIGQWEVEKVNVEPTKKGFDYYAAKDIEMAKDADYGFMIWNGQSKGTLNNMINLAKLNKKVLVYFIPAKQFYTVKDVGDIRMMIDTGNPPISTKLHELMRASEQLKLF